MGICSNCGAQIPDDAMFCIQCGTPVGSGAGAAGQTAEAAGGTNSDQSYGQQTNTQYNQYQNENQYSQYGQQQYGGQAGSQQYGGQTGSQQYGGQAGSQQYGGQAGPQQYGAQTGPQYGQYGQYNAQNQYAYDPYKVIEHPILNRGYTAIIGYLGWIGFLIAMIAGDRKEPYARFHLNQALLINLGLTIGVILELIGSALVAEAAFSYSYYSYGGSGGFIGGTILTIIALFILIFSIVCWFYGLIRACRGRNKPVVFFGQVRLLK